MRRWTATLLLSAASLAADGDDFRTRHALILPHADEVEWTAVDWGTDLWEARRRAAEEGKPIFLWEMDGHPLGCT